MVIDLNDVLYALSYALDCVEHDIVGVTTNHGKRVAYMTVALAKKCGIEKEELAELAGAALMHDSALTEAVWELKNSANKADQKEVKKSSLIAERNSLTLHCEFGEENIRHLHFSDTLNNSVLYHHETADGTGPFKKKPDETPMGAQLIHMADQVDARWNLNSVDEEKYRSVVQWVQNGRMFSKECVKIFLEAMTYDVMRNIQDDQIDQLLYTDIPEVSREYSSEELIEIAGLFAKIIDYKSEFTCNHSMGIADKCKIMAEHYGYSEEKCAKLYCAGALHDVGKLVVDSDVLEKPGKLTDTEYAHIQNHAMATYQILSNIKGIEDIAEWASLHHEKLDGTGYPFKKKAEELSQEDRMLCCLDIYQALTEDRPYKAGFSHEKTMGILKEMAEKNQLDQSIVAEVDKVFG